MQNPGSVHDAENACETKHEEVRSGVPSDAVQSFLLSTSAKSIFLPVSASVQCFIPTAAAQSSVLTSDAHRIAIPTDECADFARIYASDYVTVFTSAICGPHSCTHRRMFVGFELTVARL
jgi:hypothetical protein